MRMDSLMRHVRNGVGVMCFFVAAACNNNGAGDQLPDTRDSGTIHISAE